MTNTNNQNSTPPAKKCGGQCNCKCKRQQAPEPEANTAQTKFNNAFFKWIDTWGKWTGILLAVFFVTIILGILPPL